MKKFLYYPAVLLIGVLVFAAATPVFAQEKEAVKQQAEQKLQSMTPSQIDAAIKRAGLTTEQAKTKASELGIPLEKYLQQAGGKESGSVPEATPATNEQGQPATPTPIPAPQTPTPREEVPGFKGRLPGASLLPFGYSLFALPASTFEPSFNVPPPPEYLIGPGDELVLSLWGETQLFYRLVVSREGTVLIPDVGQITLSGLTLEKATKTLLKRMSRNYASLADGSPTAKTFLDVSLGKLRSIEVYVLGEVRRPGGYQLSALSTAFTALYNAGGPTINGTLRAVKVMRAGKTAAVIDLYDYLLRGDKSKDIRLEDGDIVFVKTAGKRAGIVGPIVREAVYELQEGERLKDLLSMAGGLRFNAYANRVHVERVVPFNERQNYSGNILDIDVPFESVTQLTSSGFPLEDGDIVWVLGITELVQNRLTLIGNVKKPGTYELLPGMRVRDLVMAADSLYPDTFGDKATLIRTLPDARRQLLTFNLGMAMNGDSAENLALENLDTVVVYPLGYFFPEHTVTVSGAVRAPGTFNRYEGMTLAKLLVLAGGLSESASLDSVEVTRIDTTSERKTARTFLISLPAQYWTIDSTADFLLEDFDHVTVKPNPKFNFPKLVSVAGEVRYPGMYALRSETDRLASIISRAGGLKSTAYPEGSTLVRVAQDAGMVPIDFVKALHDTVSADNVILMEGDAIHIGRDIRVVQVKGEVGAPAAVLYKKGASLSYYLEQAGDLTADADGDRIVVTQPNGSRWKPGWFILPDPDILAGAMIQVPKKIEKPDNTLQVISNFATVFASLAAITVAIVQVTK